MLTSMYLRMAPRTSLFSYCVIEGSSSLTLLCRMNMMDLTLPQVKTLFWCWQVTEPRVIAVGAKCDIEKEGENPSIWLLQFSAAEHNTAECWLHGSIPSSGLFTAQYSCFRKRPFESHHCGRVTGYFIGRQIGHSTSSPDAIPWCNNGVRSNDISFVGSDGNVTAWNATAKALNCSTSVNVQACVRTVDPFVIQKIINAIALQLHLATDNITNSPHQ